ncbi:MAG: hypothetical protein ACOH17_13040 [Cellulomonas sp.]
MDNETDRLARQVADAADAWLRDPLDAHVYARLVRATLDWRAAARSPGDFVQPPAAAEATDPDDDSAVDLEAVPVERRPQRLDMLLGGFADELRARTASPPVESAESAEHTQRP